MISQQRSQTYKIYKKLGQGGYGQVYLGKDSSGRQVVVKRIAIDTDNREKAMNEVKIMKKVNHNNVIHFIDSFVNKKNLIIVMEYARGGDLSRFIKKRMGDLISEDLVWNIFLQITFGLRYLHSIRILHRDMKTQNVFLMADGTVKIGDFGIGRMLSEKEQIANTVIGTPYYLSPEICEGIPYDYKSDMWSLGCILYELCTLTRAFCGSNVADVIRKILKVNPPKIPEIYSSTIQMIIDNLLSKIASSRMSADDICNLPTVKIIINDMFDVKGMTTIIFDEMNQKQEISHEEPTGNTDKGLQKSINSSTPSLREDHSELTREILKEVPDFESKKHIIDAFDRLGFEIKNYDCTGDMNTLNAEKEEIIARIQKERGEEFWVIFGQLLNYSDTLPKFFKENKIDTNCLDLIVDLLRIEMKKNRIEAKISEEKFKKQKEQEEEFERIKREVEDAERREFKRSQQTPQREFNENPRFTDGYSEEINRRF
ncbi:serine/threonine protein kinase Nek3, putative [Entamoeba dispar SAW760]|uniref:non-specific serine/threonine protein kinase n=1 Tax=Entamoeba dispar (strain ATCC PRA-260 / SAW760) TaxID=370354 RepID=B0E6H7_ENTDS|nr:serine/threonine protein kinase Nek3, putative [Entamoeba dispar SAW760]EDR29872.1 serine/threonine protein kinase Nek3, putative [Entamoeba dispar SAW760]|eukprot:EDR29872.1 serine/threonine protein kinase Nek3, putative [Entamoeba dispar SAW760]